MGEEDGLLPADAVTGPTPESEAQRRALLDLVRGADAGTGEWCPPPLVDGRGARKLARLGLARRVRAYWEGERRWIYRPTAAGREAAEALRRLYGRAGGL